MEALNNSLHYEMHKNELYILFRAKIDTIPEFTCLRIFFFLIWKSISYHICRKISFAHYILTSLQNIAFHIRFSTTPRYVSAIWVKIVSCQCTNRLLRESYKDNVYAKIASTQRAICMEDKEIINLINVSIIAFAPLVYSRINYFGMTYVLGVFFRRTYL